MKRFLPAIFIALLACSKPADQASTNDSIPGDSTVEANAAEEVAGLQPLTLTPAQTEQVNIEVFLQFHNDWLYDADPEVTAYYEDFTTKGNEFKYILYRHNGANVGEHYSGDLEYGEDRYDIPRGKYYVNEIDTIEIEGTWAAYPYIVDPERKVNKVEVLLTGYQTLVNHGYTRYMEEGVDFSPRQMEIPNITVDLQAPKIFDKSELYIKAKVTDLTEQDLAGMDKEELSYLRNEIFARHGHTFQTDKMIAYFSQQKWYHRLTDNAANLLNKYEKRNADFIKKKEG